MDEHSSPHPSLPHYPQQRTTAPTNPQNGQRKQFAGIIRVSTLGQTRADKYGPKEQRDDVLIRARALGYEDSDARWFEFWESATDASSRPKFLAIIDQIIQLRDAGTIDTIIFGRPDRLSRDGEGWFFHYLVSLEGHRKAQVRFGRGDADPENPHRMALLFFEAFKATADGQTIKLNTLPARRKRAELGGRLPTGAGGTGLFGYVYNPQTGKRELHPTNSKILRRAVDLLLYGDGGEPNSMRATLRKIEEEFQRKLVQSTLTAVCRNPAIYGHTVSKWKNPNGTIDEIVLKDATPAIISEEEFQALVRRMEEAKRWDGRQKGRFYPLAGMAMVICGECGTAFTGSMNTDRGKQRPRYRHSIHSKCSNPYRQWQSHHLETIVWDKLVTYFANPEEAKRKIQAQVSDGRVAEKLQADLDDLKRKQQEDQEYLDFIAEARARKRMSPEKYEKAATKAEKDMEARADRIREVQQNLASAREVNFDRISHVIDELAAEGLTDSWSLFPGSVEHGEEEQAEVGDYLMGPYRLDDGREYWAIDPSTNTGRAIWERRRGVMNELGLKVYVNGRNVELELNVATTVHTERDFTKSTAIQHAGDGIRANSIHPGTIETPMTADMLADETYRQDRMRRTPLGRLGRSEDVAYGALYLASDESSFVTGAELVIDGGRTAE